MWRQRWRGRKGPVFILGLTGSIGMGKTEAAKVFCRCGVSVYDSDAEVHRLFAPGGAAVAPVAQAFPGVARDGRIDRDKLGARVFGDAAALGRLEALVHPLVRARQTAFLKRAAARREPLVVLDIPLLFETGADRLCDAVAVVSAPAFVQRHRVLARPGMTPSKLDRILARQMPDREKRRRADFIIETGIGKAHSVSRIRDIVDILKSRDGRIWPAGRTFRGPHARNRTGH